MSDVVSLEKVGELANKALSSLGLNRAGVMLAEGFCPLCQKRGSGSLDALIDDEDAHPTTTARVDCTACQIRWRGGVNPENHLEWVQHAHAVEGMVLTYSLNPPAEPEEEDDWYLGD